VGRVVRYCFDTFCHSVTWGCEPTLDRQIAAAAAAQCDFVGLDVPSVLAHGVPQVGQWLDQAGIGCYELVPLRLGEDHPAMVADMATALGARAVLAVPFGPLGAELVRATREATRTLADQDVTLCLEFLPSIEINSIEAVLGLIGAVGDPAPTVVVDAWHFFAGPSTWESLEQLAPERLGFVQIDDAVPPVGDDVVHEYRNRRVIPGEGVLDLRRFADTVLRVQPDVTVSIEVLSEQWRRRTPAELVVASVDASRRLFDVPTVKRG
jgi:sugar phosphate isomerase/epimerase